MLLLTMGVGLQQVGETQSWQNDYRASSSQAGVSGTEGLTGSYWDIKLVGRIYWGHTDITPGWE